MRFPLEAKLVLLVRISTHSMLLVGEILGEGYGPIGLVLVRFESGKSLLRAGGKRDLVREHRAVSRPSVALPFVGGVGIGGFRQTWILVDKLLIQLLLLVSKRSLLRFGLVLAVAVDGPCLLGSDELLVGGSA